jgi:hypothetical protein
MDIDKYTNSKKSFSIVRIFIIDKIILQHKFLVKKSTQENAEREWFLEKSL